MTQSELAKAVGVSPEWISRIARGKAEFSLKIERRIMRVLSLTNDEANDAFHFPGPMLASRLNGKESERGSHLSIVRPGETD